MLPDLMQAEVLRRGHATVWRQRLRDDQALAVERSRIEYGRVDPYSDCFRVVEFADGCWDRLLSRHRKKTAAVRAMKRFARRRRKTPPL